MGRLVGKRKPSLGAFVRLKKKTINDDGPLGIDHFLPSPLPHNLEGIYPVRDKADLVSVILCNRGIDAGRRFFP